MKFSIRAGLWTLALLTLLIFTATFFQNKTPIKQIDDATWVWGSDSIFIRMRITATSRDTIVTYYHYKLVKTTKVHHFDVQRFLDSQKFRWDKN